MKATHLALVAIFSISFWATATAQPCSGGAIATQDTVCVGESSTLTATPATAIAYLWSTGQTTAEIIVTPTATTTYSVTITVSANCAVIVSEEVAVVPAPVADFLVAVDGLTVEITDQSTNADSVFVNFGDGTPPIPAGNISHAYAQAGSYTVTLTATNDCGTATATQTVTVTDCQPACDPPIVGVSASASGLNVTFANSSQNVDTHFWNFGDGTTSTAATPPVHTYPAGEWTATYVATNECDTVEVSMTFMTTEPASQPSGFFIWFSVDTDQNPVPGDGIASQPLGWGNTMYSSTGEKGHWSTCPTCAKSSWIAVPYGDRNNEGIYWYQFSRDNGEIHWAVLTVGDGNPFTGTTGDKSPEQDGPGWDFQVKGNPFTDYIAVDLINPPAGVEFSVSLFSLNGETIYSSKENGDFELDGTAISSMPAGSYFLQVGDGMNFITKQVVKQ